MRAVCTSTVLDLLNHAINGSEGAVVHRRIDDKSTQRCHRLISLKSVVQIFTGYEKGLPTWMAFKFYLNG